MQRKEFVKLCAILGIGLPAQGILNSCNKSKISDSKEVLIIGAGAGGLSAGYLLNQEGINFRILEASSEYGGRMRINEEFADFPIPLGSEWIHEDASILQEMLGDPSQNVSIETASYDSQKDNYGHWENNQLSIQPLEDADIKFVNSSWYDFYRKYIVPPIIGKIEYNSAVISIDYSGDQVEVKTKNETIRVDKVILSIPLKILQDGDVDFTPNLPESKRTLIDDMQIWSGFKAFFEFSEKFYLTQTGFTTSPESAGQKLFYDAAYGQNSSKNILGVFAVGSPADHYGSLSSDELKNTILKELDEIYNNAASASYISHIIQDWNKEPFIKSGYLTDHADWEKVRQLRTSVDNKLFFAGGAFTNGEDWVSVHAAAQSAKDAVKEVMSG